MQRAIKSQGGQAFRHNDFVEPLQLLLTAANDEANLNGFGRVMLRTLVGYLLTHRLRLEAWREQHTEIDQQRIERPLIIAGLPRTGTTFLHQLLSQDSQFRSPRTFEIDRPVPPPLQDALQNDPRVAEVQRGVDMIHRVVPHMQAIHPIAAHFPDECQQITFYQFASIGFQHIMDVPSYRDWLLQRDYTADLAFHQRFLQHLQSAWMAGHWLLKSPSHVQYLPALLQQYPDAMLIHTHRDPQQVMGSVSSLSWTMQDVFSDTADPLVAGRGQLDYWSAVSEICLADREQLGNTDAIYDLRYPDLIERPIATVEAIYQHFGLVLSSEAKTAMLEYIASHKQDKRGTHRYQPAAFGVDGIDDIDVFRRYRQRFSV